MEGKHQAGKGDSYRKVDQDIYRKNYIEIFGEKEVKTWQPSPEDDPRKEKKNENDQGNQ
jgi:hypothetical protein